MGATGTLQSIDWLIIATYLFGTLFIGSYYGKYVQRAGDLFLAGKGLPFWAIAMSIVVTDIGATNLTFGAGNAYKYGIAQANYDWIGSMPACLIAGLLFIPFFWRSGVYTIPEFLGRRYNTAVQRVSAVIWLVYLAINLAIMMHASALILESFVGFQYELSIWGTALLVGIYTVTGGLAAVVMTDALQMIVIFVGTAALLGLGFWEVGGWSGLTERLATMGPETQNHMELLYPHSSTTSLPWTAVVFGLGIVQSTAYFVNNQAIVQRNLGARSEWDAKAGMILAGFFKIFMPILIFFPGLIARVLFPGLKETDRAVPTLILELFPPGLTGLMVAAFMAAFMSGVSSYLNSTSTMFLADVYIPLYRGIRGRQIPDLHALRVGRASTTILIVTACLFAPTFRTPNAVSHDPQAGAANTTAASDLPPDALPVSAEEAGSVEADSPETEAMSIYDMIQLMMSFFQGPTLAIMLLGILWRRANGWGGLAGLVGGVAFTTYLTYRGKSLFVSEDPFLFVSFWAFLFSIGVTVVVSLLTKPELPEKTRGLVLFEVAKKQPVPSVSTGE